MKKIFILSIIIYLIFNPGFIFSQNSIPDNSENLISIKYNEDNNYYLVERSDLRRYENGRYTGLTSREVRSFISIMDDYYNHFNNIDDSIFYDGNFYVIENTKTNGSNVSEGINDAIPSTFKISPSGKLTMLVDNGYPSFRTFPSYPDREIKKGDIWEAMGERAVDPLNKGIITKLPIYVQYQYMRDGTYHGEEVFILKGKWATRYGISYFDPTGDKELKSANGSHSADIYVSKKTGCAVLIKDMVDETFIYKDGTNVSQKGFITLFTEYPPSLDRENFLPVLNRVAKLREGNSSTADTANSTGTSNTVGSTNTTGQTNSDIEYTETNAGLRLTIKNLQFYPDSAELLPGEKERLNLIAEVLSQAGNSMFLIEGHTASTGNPRGEKQLSKERALSIAKELVDRGIPGEKFICKGSGGTKPVADNSTPEGKALNRRVEITILE